MPKDDGFTISNRVIVRSRMGQFIRDMEGAATKTVEEAIARGEKYSKERAPVGSRPDKRSITIRQGFFRQITGRTSGYWGNSARHAYYQEKGTKPHLIIGNPTMRFYWESKGRMWEPGLFGEPDIINHPGHAAQPFLYPAYRKVMRELNSIAKKHYPGGMKL